MDKGHMAIFHVLSAGKNALVNVMLGLSLVNS